jgi:hypothetical protein
MKTAIEIINERMNEGKNVYFSFNKTNAEGKTLDEIIDEKFDKLDTDIYRVENVELDVNTHEGVFSMVEGPSSTCDRCSVIRCKSIDISTIILPADVEEYYEELCEVIQF